MATGPNWGRTRLEEFERRPGPAQRPPDLAGALARISR